MPSEDEIVRKWLVDLLDAAKHGIKGKLAAYLKVRPDVISRLISSEGEKRQMSAIEMAKIAQFFGVAPPSLGPTKRTRPEPRASTSVPLVSWVSAGKMTEAMTPLEGDFPVFSMPDLEPGDYIALEVHGDSMDRISPEHSVIIVDRRDKQLATGKPYVFAIRGEATYKLWRPKPHPRLEPFSTNPANEPIFVDQRHKLFVVGRVRRTSLEL